MLNFGVQANEIVEDLRMIGDVTGGNAEKMHLLSLAFSQSAATGRLMGQDLLQMVNSGFNPLKEISDKTGISMTDLKKRMESGGISFAAVREAFRSATGEGGRFNGMLIEQGNTFAGRMAKMRDQFEMTMLQIGSELTPILKKGADMATYLMQAFSSLGSVGAQSSIKIAAFAATFATVVNIIPKVIAGFRAVASAMALTQAAAGPAGIASLAIGLAAAAGAMVVLDSQFNTLNQSIEKASASTKNATEAKHAIADAQRRINGALNDGVVVQTQFNSKQAEALRLTHANATAQFANAKQAENEAREQYKAVIEAIDAKRKGQREQIVRNSGISGVFGLTNHFAQDEFDSQAEKARAAAYDKHKSKIDALAEASSRYKNQVQQLGEAIESNADLWKEYADDTRLDFVSPLNALRDILKRLAEEVKQGGLELSVFDQAAQQAINNTRAKIETPREPLQFAGIVRGSQDDVQTAFRFQNMVHDFRGDKLDKVHFVLEEIKREIIFNGKVATQPKSDA
jgi:tape measure domain-containing protein